MTGIAEGLGQALTSILGVVQLENADLSGLWP